MVEQFAVNLEYICTANINVYDSPRCDRLATQAAQGRHLRMVTPAADQRADSVNRAIAIELCEDDYPGWLNPADFAHLEPAANCYRAKIWSATDIPTQLPAVIAFTHAAMATPNYYLWGGTLSPNYDCSGLMQAAFGSVGIWLPRDAYQQEAFTQKIAIAALQPGDLVFFGTPQKATHVGLYLGEKRYIHSSGKDQGRNGIGIDMLSETGDAVSQAYYQQLRGAGRVVASYQPQRMLIT